MSKVYKMEKAKWLPILNKAKKDAYKSYVDAENRYSIHADELYENYSFIDSLEWKFICSQFEYVTVSGKVYGFIKSLADGGNGND